MDSRELVRRLCDTPLSDPLWGEFVRRCRITIRRAIRAHGNPGAAEEAADIEQEVFKRLVSGNRARLRDFDASGKVRFEGYLRRVADSVLADWYRRRQRRVAAEPEPLSPEETRHLDPQAHRVFGEPGALHPEHDLRIREVEEEVQAYLETTLPDPMDRALSRRIFQLHFKEGYSIQQISRLKAVPLSASAISRRANTLRRHLRKVLDPISDDYR